MTQNQTYALMVLLTLIAYKAGQKKAAAMAPVVPADPMAWLYNYRPV